MIWLSCDWQSRTVTEGIVLLNCYASHMSEVVVWNTDWVQVVNSCIHVQTGLDIVSGYALFFELLGCSSMWVWNGFVFLWDPASLGWCFLFLVTLLFDVFAEHCGDGFYCLFESDLSVVSCWYLIFSELGLGSVSGWLLFGRESSFVFWDIVCVFLYCWMLG